MDAIVVDGLCKDYGSLRAVDGVARRCHDSRGALVPLGTETLIDEAEGAPGDRP
jgi:hypothetical protein